MTFRTRDHWNTLKSGSELLISDIYHTSTTITSAPFTMEENPMIP